MAVDMALMELAERGGFDIAFRTYTWKPHAVSLGRLEKEGMDGPGLRRDSIGLVRRPTGGRAVWHGRELTYSVTAGRSHPLFQGGVEASLGAVASVLLEALKALGVPASANRAREGRAVFGKGPCFTSHGRSEIMTPDGRKLVGSAQARTAGAFLEHGSILFDNDQPRLLDYTPDKDPDRRLRMKQALEKGTGTVREFLPRAAPEDLVPHLMTAFRSYCGVPVEHTDHTLLPRDSILRLSRECSP